MSKPESMMQAPAPRFVFQPRCPSKRRKRTRKVSAPVVSEEQGAVPDSDKGNGISATSTDVRAGNLPREEQDRRTRRVTDRGGYIDNSHLHVSETEATAGAGGEEQEGTEADVSGAKILFQHGCHGGSGVCDL